jgi:predicted porin
MKKNIIALAVASAIAAPVAMADAPVVYGKINVNAKFADGADLNIGDTSSRVGIKGSDDLGNGLKAVYKLEFDVDVAGKTKDGDTKGTLTARNQYLGLAGGFGTVLMGRHDTPEKMSQASDLFNDGAADLANGSMTSGVTVNETRSGNVVAYVSPSFSGVKLIAAAVANGVDAKGATSAALTYGSTKKGLYLAAAMTDYKTNGSNTDSKADTTRFSAQYKTGGLTANTIYMTANDGPSDGTITQVNLGYKIGKFMPKLKVSMADPKAAGVKSTTNMSVGLNYSLGKKTTAYIYTVDADTNNTAKKAADQTIVGMVHKF